jgi:hypothetical protein
LQPNYKILERIRCRPRDLAAFKLIARTNVVG